MAEVNRVSDGLRRLGMKERIGQSLGVLRFTLLSLLRIRSWQDSFFSNPFQFARFFGLLSTLDRVHLGLRLNELKPARAFVEPALNSGAFFPS